MLRADIYIGWDYIGTIQAAQSFIVTLRHNLVGEASITIEAGHDLASYLFDHKARAIIYYKDQPVMSGWLRTTQIQGYPKQLTITVKDDKAFLWNMLGWPIPTNAITAQSSTHYKVTAVAETAIKQIIAANAAVRFPYLNVVATAGRGASISIKSRFALLSEFLPLIEPNGITAIQNGNKIDVDFYVPGTYPATIKEATGVVTVNSFSNSRPTLTRVIVGDQGQKTSRNFRQVIDSTTETDFVEVLESFVDARDTNDSTEINDRANEALTEGAAKAGLSVSLAEIGDFAYGEDGFVLGDYVPIELIGGTMITEQITEVVISQTIDNGTTVTPKIGDSEDEPTKKLVKTIQNLSTNTKSLMREW